MNSYDEQKCAECARLTAQFGDPLRVVLCEEHATRMTGMMTVQEAIADGDKRAAYWCERARRAEAHVTLLHGLLDATSIIRSHFGVLPDEPAA